LSYLVKGRTLKSITENYSAFWASLTRGDSQLRWLGPEKGVIHLAAAALVNATWDLYSKAEKKPLWKLLYVTRNRPILPGFYLSDGCDQRRSTAILKKPGKERKGWLPGKRISRLPLHRMETGYPMKTQTPLQKPLRAVEIS
jgi:L-fuconate dehydratase